LILKGHLEKHKIKYEYLDGKTTDCADSKSFSSKMIRVGFG
jgi:hypothetical protein